MQTYPRCVHLSEPLRGRSSQLLWGACAGSAGYRIEREIYDRNGIGSGYFEIYTGEGQPSDEHHSWLNWREIHARARTFEDMASEQLTFGQFLNLGPYTAHFALIDLIPEDAYFVRYRVKSIYPDGESAYRYSEKYAVTRQVKTADVFLIEAAKGQRIELVITADMARRMPDSMALTYDHEMLEIKESRGPYFSMIAKDQGTLDFRAGNEAANGHVFSGGPAAVIVFEALKAGSTGIKMD